MSHPEPTPTDHLTNPDEIASIARLDNEIAYLETHPEEWNQGLWIGTPHNTTPQKWSCGTVACLGGFVAIHAGWTPDPNNPDVEIVGDGDGGPETTAHHYVTKNGETKTVFAVARELLMLTEDQAEYLFASENSIHDLKYLRNEIVHAWEGREPPTNATSVAVSGAGATR